MNRKKGAAFFKIAALIFIISGFSLVSRAAGDDVRNAFIPAGQGFDFASGRVVEEDDGDIEIRPYEIYLARGLLILYIDRGFLDDFGRPDDNDPRWRNFAEYVDSGVYALRYKNGGCALFELVNVLTDADEVTGVEIDYYYYPGD